MKNIKIVFASKFYYRRGGLETYLFNVKNLLEQNSHTVIPFSTNYKENIYSDYENYFCTYHSLEKFNPKNILTYGKVFKNMIFNSEAHKQISHLLDKEKPHIVQGFGVTKHLSASIFKAAKERKIPTIMRLSDFSLLCPNSVASDGNGQICKDFNCLKWNGYKKILKTRCIKNSALLSIAGLLEVKLNNFFSFYKQNVDHFIAPSKFLRNIFINFFNLPENKIHYLPVFFDCKNSTIAEEDMGYFLYAGRMDDFKGVPCLLKAFLHKKNSHLFLAGTGPKEDEYQKFSFQNNINAKFLGHQSFEDLQTLIEKCRAVILPSECYENSPNIVLEAFAKGKPVVASNIGGIPELVKDFQTGLLFEAGNSLQLTEKINSLEQNQKQAKEMGIRGRLFLEQELNAKKHYSLLINLYNNLIEGNI